MNKKITQFLLDKEMQKWLEENKGLMEDYTKLCNELLMFRMKWGMEIGIMFNDPKEMQGRWLGKGIVEDIFEKAGKWKFDSDEKI